MNLTEIKKIYSPEQVKDISKQLKYIKSRHNKRNPDNSCRNCGYNEENISIIKCENDNVLVVQYGNFSNSNGKTKCCECRNYC